MTIEVDWIKIAEAKPSQDQVVLVSDGKEVWIAECDLTNPTKAWPIHWRPIMLGGYEWEWCDDNPQWWAPFTVNLPKE